MNYLLTIILAFMILSPNVQAMENVENFTLFYSNDMHGETEPCG